MIAIERASNEAFAGVKFQDASLLVWGYCYAAMRDREGAATLTMSLMEKTFQDALIGHVPDPLKALQSAIEHFDTYGGKKQEHYSRNQTVVLYLIDGAGLNSDEAAQVMNKNKEETSRLIIEARRIFKEHGLPAPIPTISEYYR